MLRELKNFDPDRTDMDELVALSGFARMMLNTYADHAVDPPEWLTMRDRMIGREITQRSADQLEARLAEARRKFDTLKTPAEKRKETLAEIEQIESQLGRVSG